MPNIQTSMRIEYGATYNGRASLYASSNFNTTNAVIIGANGVIELYEGAYIETEFTPETDHAKYGRTTAAGQTKLAFNGGAKDNALSLKVSIVEVSTEKCLLGIPYNFSFIFENGTYDLTMQYKLMPGASFTVGENATVNLTNNFIIYTGDFTESITNVGDNTTLSAYYYPTTVGDAEFFVTGSGILNVQKGAFGGTVKGETGAQVSFAAEITLSVDSFEVTKFKKIFLFGSVEDVQTITKAAQLDGYAEELAAGTTYTYNGTAWEAKPLA